MAKCDCCNFSFDMALSVVDDGEKRYYLCPTHLLMYFSGQITPESNHTSELKKKRKRCSLCKEAPIYLKDNGAEYYLCREHMTQLVKRKLSQKDFNKLYKKVGHTFLLNAGYTEAVIGVEE